MSISVASNVANESGDLGVNTIVLGGWDFQEDADTGRPQSLLSVHQHGLDVLRSRVGDRETQMTAGRVMNRLERAAVMFNGAILEKCEDRILACFDTPDEALQAAIEMQNKVATALPVSGVRLAIGAGITIGRIGDSYESDREVFDAVTELGRSARPGDVSLCGSTKKAISPALAAKLDSYKQALPPMPLPANAEPESTDQPLWCLILECDGRMFIIDEQNPELTIGRDPSNQVVLKNRYASRYHATINYVAGRFVLIDKSTNGTLSMHTNGSQKLLQNEEGDLHGTGILVFSNKHSAPMAAKARFEII